MKFMLPLSFIVTVLAASVQAQEASSSVATPDAAAAREALAKKESDVSQADLLKTTLTAVDKQYSLLKRGSRQLTYNLNYAYIGQDKINTDLSSGNATLFSIENDNSHTVTNTLTFDYGLRDNLTASVTLPLVSKYAQTATLDGVSNSIGDITMGARFQPIEAQRDKPSLTLSGNLRLPTGTSPFKVVAGSGLATGSGTAALTGGVNVSKIVDPVALFGSLSLTYSLPAKNLSQVLNASVLTQVKPGPSLGIGVGFAYALSYAITTSFSFQESIAAGSTLTFQDGTQAKTKTQTSGMFNLGMGYRVSPKTTVNTTLGIGLTANSPNLTIDVSLPLSL